MSNGFIGVKLNTESRSPEWRAELGKSAETSLVPVATSGCATPRLALEYRHFQIRFGEH